MSQGNFKKIMADSIGKKKLSNTQLKQLMQLQKSTPSRRNNKAYFFIAAVASVFLGVFVTQLYLTSNISIQQKIGNEVAKNHIKLKPLEIQSAQLSEISRYFTELDFSPIASQIVNLDNHPLIGGRYCSIQGITAAQLRLQNKSSGKVQSLYQTVYKPELFKSIPQLKEGQGPVTVYSKGIAIDIWVEKGILFALTKDN